MSGLSDEFSELPLLFDELLARREAAKAKARAPTPASTPRPATDKLKRARAYLAGIPGAVSGQGGHDQTWTAAQAMVRGFDLDEHEALELLVADYNPRCDPSWSERELQHKVRDAAQRSQLTRGYLLDEKPKPRLVSSNPTPDKPPVARLTEKLTDVGNALRLIDVHGNNLRYVNSWDKWLVWDGKRWAFDERLTVQHYASGLGVLWFSDADGIDDPGVADKVRKHAKRSLNRGGVEAAVALARAVPGVAVTVGELDVDPWVLNVANGTIDLRTGALQAHRSQDMLTKLAPWKYDAGASCPVWMAFLRRVLGDRPALFDYVQRALGYALTGDVSEQCLFFLHGGGKNGKSTFVTVLLELMGDYARAGAPNLLLSKQGETHPTEQADLFARRLVVCQETEEGKRWDESTVKQLTGGDMIAARRMREDFWQFKPTHKFFVTGNHKPSVTGTDEGIWRRLNLIPFTVTIPVEERDPHLIDKLRAEYPAILAWLVDGCRRWQSSSLDRDRPAEVTEAVAQYREEQDTFGDFLGEKCVVGEDEARITRAALRRLYDDWCKENGAAALGPQRFTAKIRDRGCSPAKVWTGAGSRDGWSRIRERIGTDQ